ncbi:MAG: outer membrane protein assembly factor BamA [Desulfovibrionaceae bacterium]|jgi:outer membrane protein insertion porin family|nr:outer membrane protein assembly factor BamA [Desulfovibrionaceae bacterium]
MPKPISALPALALLLLLLLLPGRALCAQGDAVKVAVLPFEVNAGPDLEYLKDSLPQLVSDKLTELGFAPVPQERLLSLLTQQNVEFLDLAVAKDMALLSGAAYAVYGSFSQVGETLSLDVRLVDAFGVKPAKPIFVVKEGLINILPAVDELAAKIKNELQRKEVVAELSVTGTKVLDKEVVLMRLKTQKGDVYDPKTINDDMKRVFELGYFKDLRVHVDDLPEGKRVVFEVEEKPRIKAISVLGADALNEEDIVGVMSTRTGGVMNEKVLSDDLNKIRELYRKDGYYLAKVTYELEQDSDTQARLNLVVQEGEKLYIEKIIIEGAEQIDPDELKDQLALSERGIISWITGSGVLKEELLERDAAALEAYYANRGFVDAKVGQPSVEFKDDGIYITFKLSEGDRYKIGAIQFAGDLLEPEPKLLEQTALDDIAREDGYFDRSVLREDANKLSAYYADYGYAFAEADYTLKKRTEEKRLDVTYSLSKRQKVYIRRVNLEGNSRTRDNVIRREMRLADGDLFSGSKLRRSTERLNKLGYFEVADVETMPTGNPDQLDLKVKVKEKATGLITGGVGYSTYSHFGVTGKIEEKNLFGKGYVTGAQASISGKSTRFGVGFTNPSYDDTKLGVGADLYRTRYEAIDYDRVVLGGRLRFSYPLGEYTKLYWSYRLDRYDIYNLDDDTAQLIRDKEGVNWASVISVSALRDTTDDAVNPTKGSLNSLTLENGGAILAGDDNFFKGVADSHWFFPVIWDTVFHWHGQLGFVVENADDEIPVFERFHLGGLNTIRGYSTGKVSPRDEATGDYIGGNKEFYTNFEYIFPLDKDFGLMGLTFFDAGNSWDEGDWDLGDIKKSVGAGLRWYSPMGPLRLEYGYALDSITDQGSPHKIEFSMGTNF